MTFAEYKKVDIFDWDEFIKHYDSGTVSLDELRAARKAASEWDRCPCGNMSNLISRDYAGKPDDADLRNHRVRFYEQLKCLDRDLFTTYQQLKSREAELVKNLINSYFQSSVVNLQRVIDLAESVGDQPDSSLHKAMASLVKASKNYQ